LSYEDVTNVDSLGIITARSHVSIADSILHTGDTDTSIRFPSANTFTIETAGDERLRVGGTGNIGINETSPQQKLHVGGDVEIGFTSPNDAGRQIIFNTNRSTAGNTLANLSWEWNGTTVAQVRGIAGDDTSNKDDAHLAFFTAPAGSIQERLRIASNGKVGIGSEIPTEVLDVSGTSDMKMVVQTKSSGAGSNAGVRIATGDGYKWLLQVGDSTTSGGLRIYQETSGSSGERLRIGSAGQIGLGGANYGTSGQVLTSNGASSAPTWQDASGGGGITTEAATPSNAVVQINLTDATDHKITATGICTITSTTSGTEGQSHTIRIVNSGIATVGFSTYFLFPSGSVPSLPTADGAVSIISFTVHDSVGAGCTQLLAGASVNFS